MNPLGHRYIHTGGDAKIWGRGLKYLHGCTAPNLSSYTTVSGVLSLVEGVLFINRRVLFTVVDPKGFQGFH
jgi:hypothetical protein